MAKYFLTLPFSNTHSRSVLEHFRELKLHAQMEKCGPKNGRVEWECKVCSWRPITFDSLSALVQVIALQMEQRGKPNPLLTMFYSLSHRRLCSRRGRSYDTIGPGEPRSPPSRSLLSLIFFDFLSSPRLLEIPQQYPGSPGHSLRASWPLLLNLPQLPGCASLHGL